ncbi:unnamed protein product [Rotaria sp. Silwood1]|nr:unnamed protein product [Rotaria sp. Silwood1]
MNISQMLSVPLTRVRSQKLKRQTTIEDDIDIQQNQSSKSIPSDYESNSSRSLSPYWRIIMDPESSSSYLDVPDTSNNSRRSSNNSVVRFIQNDASDLCSILDMTNESENLEKAIINNDKYTVRRIIDIHKNKFNLIKDNINQSENLLIYPIHRLRTSQPIIYKNPSNGSPSITSNTDLLEAYSKQALVSYDTDDPPSISSIEHQNNHILTSSTATIINNQQYTINQNNNIKTNLSSHNITSSINDPIENDNDSIYTSIPATTFNKQIRYTNNDSPNDAPPIFRNVLHVAIIYDARDVMRICLKYGIDPNIGGINPNIQQISSNNYNQINSNLSNDLPHASSCRDGTLDYTSYYTTERLFTLPPLFLAAQRNNHYACILLLKYGANVNIHDEQYCSPLHLAARLQHNVSEILIYNHALITIENKYEFRKLCRKHSSNCKRYRFITRDNEQCQGGISLINNNNNNSNNLNNGLIPSNGLKNLKRVFRYSGSDSYDSKSFKKSFSSQGSIGKSKRLITNNNNQQNIPTTSFIRNDSKQISDEHDDFDISYFHRQSIFKRKKDLNKKQNEHLSHSNHYL